MRSHEEGLWMDDQPRRLEKHLETSPPFCFYRRTKIDLATSFLHCFFFFFVFLPFFWATLAAYGGSQARGRIGTVAASLHQSHSNSGSEPHLQTIPQLTATSDPEPTERGQGLNLQPHGSWIRWPLSHNRNSFITS